MPTDIFISYRRVGGRDAARNVELALRGEGYESIFFDFNSLRDGVFNDQIFEAIDSCKDYLLILSDGALDRCANEGDWVAIEIRRALTADCKIIPIRVGEGEFKWPEDLPKDLRILKSIQFLNLKTDEYFHDSIRHLTERMDSKPTRVDKKASEQGFVLSLTVDETCDLLINGERIRKIRQGKAARVDFLERKNSYHFTLKSLAIQTDVIEFDLAVPEFSKSMEKQVSFEDLRKERTAREVADRMKQKRAREWQKENRRGLLRSYSFIDKEIDGRTLVGEKKGDLILYGFVNPEGYEIIPCVFQDAVHFSEGLAAVFDGDRWSYIDPNGNTILHQVSETPGLFMHGVVPISREGKFGLIDADGHELLPLVYSLVTHACDPIVVAEASSGSFHVFGLDGKPLSPHRSYESVTLEPMEIGRTQGWRIAYPCMVKKFNRFGLLASDGHLLFNCVADKMREMTVDRSVRAFENKIGIGSHSIAGLSHFYFPGQTLGLRDLFSFQVKGLWGALDPDTGKVVIQARYRHLSLTRLGFLFSEVCGSEDYGEEDAFGILSMVGGGVVIPPEYCSLFVGWVTPWHLAFKHKDLYELLAHIGPIPERRQEWRSKSKMELLLSRLERGDSLQQAFPQPGDFSFDVTVYRGPMSEEKHYEFKETHSEVTQPQVKLTHDPEEGLYIHSVWPMDPSYEVEESESERFLKKRFTRISNGSSIGLMDSSTHKVIVPPVYDEIEYYGLHYGFEDDDPDDPHLSTHVCMGNYRGEVRITVDKNRVQFNIALSMLKYSIDIVRQLFPFLNIPDNNTK